MMLLRFIVVAILISILLACGSIEPEDNPQVIGDTSWFDKTSKEQVSYLLSAYGGKADATETFSWPPDCLTRILDISIDVTGSGLVRESLYQGRKMSLAEHNIRKFFIEYLPGRLRPGDRLILRVYGSNPGGKRIRVDLSQQIEYPRDQIQAETRHPSRRDEGFLQLVVKNVIHADADKRKEAIAKALDWSLEALKQAGGRSERFQTSPLLRCLHDACGQAYASSYSERSVIFVTDGHFHLGNLYYDPKTYTLPSHSVNRIKRLITDLDLKPFLTADSKTDVILFGLVTDDDQVFARHEEEILKWCFDSKQIEILRN
jgi:hypothetical protein